MVGIGLPNPSQSSYNHQNTGHGRPVIILDIHGANKMSLPTTATSTWRKVLDTNSASTTNLAGKGSTTTKPEGTGIIVPNGAQNNSLVVIPLHDGSDTNTYDVSIHAYSMVPESPPVYVPMLLCQVTCTNTTLTAIVDGTTFQLPDTIVQSAGDTAIHVTTNGLNYGAFFVVDTYGSSYLEFEFDAVSAGNMNALVRWI